MSINARVASKQNISHTSQALRFSWSSTSSMCHDVDLRTRSRLLCPCAIYVVDRSPYHDDVDALRSSVANPSCRPPKCLLFLLRNRSQIIVGTLVVFQVHHGASSCYPSTLPRQLYKTSQFLWLLTQKLSLIRNLLTDSFNSRDVI